jgi:YNFM family putative membrane transporter
LEVTPRIEKPRLGASSPSKIARGSRDFVRVSAGLFFGAFATFALLYSVQPLMPELARNFSVSPAVSSLSLSATTGVLAAALIVASTISEIVGRKRVMVASLVASSAATMLAAIAQNWSQLIALRALTGLALSGLPAVAMAYLSDEMDASAIGLGMGIYIAGSTLGGMAGRLGVAAIADYADWRAALAVVGAIGFASAAALFLSLRESTRFTPRRPDPRALWASLIGHFGDPGLRMLFTEAFLLMGRSSASLTTSAFALSRRRFRSVRPRSASSSRSTSLARSVRLSWAIWRGDTAAARFYGSRSP